MRFKPGCRVSVLSPQIVLALVVAQEVWRAHGRELVVTSGSDGTHSRGSEHYIGNAADLRTNTLPDPTLAAKDLQERLGPDFQVILEGDHIHVEFDPQEAL